MSLEVDGQESVARRGHDEGGEAEPDLWDAQDVADGDGATLDAHRILGLFHYMKHNLFSRVAFDTVRLGLATYALRQKRDACDWHEYLDAAHDHEGQVEAAHAQHQAADGRTEHLGKVHHRASQRLNISRKTMFDYNFVF